MERLHDFSPFPGRNQTMGTKALERLRQVEATYSQGPEHLALTIWTALADQRAAANTGLVQRALILVYWTWIVLLGLHLL
jgi:hypothetical protein